MSTHPTLTQMLVAAHAADLTEQARQAGAVRTSERHPAGSAPRSPGCWSGSPAGSTVDSA